MSSAALPFDYYPDAEVAWEAIGASNAFHYLYASDMAEIELSVWVNGDNPATASIPNV